MESVWFKPGKERTLKKYIMILLQQWQIALRDYQKKTGELGFDTTEKANFGFFIWGCAQLKMPFLLEYTTEGKWGKRDRGQRRPDAWIWINKKTHALIEVKMIWDNLNTPLSQDKIRDKIDLLKEELTSIRSDDKQVKRIGLCFITLWRNKKFMRQESNEKALKKYLAELKRIPFIDFFAAYNAPKSLYMENVDKEKWIFPAVVLVGHYV